MYENDLTQIKPVYYDMLTKQDQSAYDKLRAIVSSNENKYIKNQRCQTIQAAFNMIREYCVRDDEDDWKRYLTCGICWIDNDIAINIRHLRLLLNKCKSSINGALVKMGYGAEMSKGDGCNALISKIPFLKGNFMEQRQWTIRRKVLMSPRPTQMFTPLYSPYMKTPQPMMLQLPLLGFQPYIEKAKLFGQPMCCNNNYAQTQLSNEDQKETFQKDLPIPQNSALAQNQQQNTKDYNDHMFEEFEMDAACCMPIEWVDDINEDEVLGWS